MYKFLKIINGKEYEDYLTCKGLYRYIPKKILKIFQGKIKARVICDYISKKQEVKVGLGVGIFLNDTDIQKDEYKHKIISTINNLKQQSQYRDIEYLVVDDLKLDAKDIKEIRQQCDVKVPEGKSLFASNVSRCLDEICKKRNQGMSEKEVFIISDNTKVTQDLVIELAFSSRLISIYSKDEQFSEKIQRDVLNKTGLSLNITQTLDICFDYFDFIINLGEDIDFNLSKLNKNKVIIDVSVDKSLSIKSRKKTKGFILIDDMFFENDYNIYRSDGKDGFARLLNSSMCTLLSNSNDNMKKLQVYGKICSIEDVINMDRFKKQITSCFKKTESP